MTIREALEKQGLNVIDENKEYDSWWQVEHKGYIYTIRTVDGKVDWNTRFHVDKYIKVGNEYSHQGKICTRANLNKVISLIKIGGTEQ